MPIKIPDNLPVGEQLTKEGLFVMHEHVAIRQDIRPLQIALLNLMPLKEMTELQLARLIGATPLQIELTLIMTESYVPGNVSSHHLNSYYKPWSQIKDKKFDGMIITGAPVETMPFEAVKYWQELCDIFDWTQTNVHSTLDICWGAQAALYHFYQIPKHPLTKKAFGVFPHKTYHRQNPLLRGFSDELRIPVSRHTQTNKEDIIKHPELELLIDSDLTGLCLVEAKAINHICMFNHLEYDHLTLKGEYERDIAEQKAIDLPYGYFPQDNPSHNPPNVWRSHAHLFFANWINQIYQTVPFNLNEIGTKPMDAVGANATLAPTH